MQCTKTNSDDASQRDTTTFLDNLLSTIISPGNALLFVLYSVIKPGLARRADPGKIKDRPKKKTGQTRSTR